MLQHARVKKVLIDRGHLILQHRVEVCEDGRIALHGRPLWLGWNASAGCTSLSTPEHASLPHRVRSTNVDYRRGQLMQQRSLGRLWPVSTLTLGGGGLGMVWGETTFDECVATVHAAVAAGISLIDLAPRYGDGKAEEVVGASFSGRLPEGVRVTSKCNLGNILQADIEPMLRRSIEGSLGRLHLSRLDLFFLHSNVVPDERHIARWPDAALRMTLYDSFVAQVRPVLEKLVGEGLIGAWGLTGIGHPDTIIRLLGEWPAPMAVQCIANLLDSPGALKFFDGPAKPREVMAAARANGAGVMGIRAVQAGALTSAIDRPLPE